MSSKIKEEMKKAVVKDTEPTKEQIKELEQALKEAKMPVKLTDKDFKLGECELDIRNLNDKNLAQMMFRMQILNIVYQRQMTQSLVDVLRLEMIIAKKLGVEDVIKATDDLLRELTDKITKTEA